jgi:hypothetical protein
VTRDPWPGEEGVGEKIRSQNVKCKIVEEEVWEKGGEKWRAFSLENGVAGG